MALSFYVFFFFTHDTLPAGVSSLADCLSPSPLSPPDIDPLTNLTMQSFICLSRLCVYTRDAELQRSKQHRFDNPECHKEKKDASFTPFQQGVNTSYKPQLWITWPLMNESERHHHMNARLIIQRVSGVERQSLRETLRESEGDRPLVETYLR